MAHNIRISLLFIILLAVSVCSLWFYSIEAYYETSAPVWSKEAQRNPYLAGELFLASTGIRVRQIRSLPDMASLVPDKTTLFISSNTPINGQRNTQSLVDWMNHGGHVIYTAPQEARYDPLLKVFAVIRADENLPATITEGESEPVDAPSDDTGADSDDGADSCDNGLTELHFTSPDISLLVDFSYTTGLWHPYLSDDGEFSHIPFYWAGNDDGIHFMQFEVGAGLLSVISSDSLWKNSNLRNNDNAFLLFTLANSDQLIIVNGNSREHFTLLLWRYAPEAIFSFAVLIALFLTHLARRMGPILEISRNKNRSIEEHLLASGHYLWQATHDTRFIAELRDDIIQVMARQGMISSDTSRTDICKLLAELTSLPESMVNEHLYSQKPLNEAGLLEALKILQTIRNSL